MVRLDTQSAPVSPFSRACCNPAYVVEKPPFWLLGTTSTSFSCIQLTMNTKRIILSILTALCLVVVYFLVFPSEEPESSANRGRGGFGGFGGSATVVKTEPIAEGPYAAQGSFVGNLQGIAFAELYAKTNGPITAIYAETGDAIRAGQVLAQIDNAEAQQGVRQAEAAIKMAEATEQQRAASLQVAEMNAQRNQTLFDKQLVAQQQYDAIQAELLSAQAQVQLAVAQVEQARANLSAAQLRLANTQVVAPFNGFIGKRFLDLGAFATTNRPVFSMVDLSTIKTTIPLVDKDVYYVQPGQKATITSDVVPERVFEGTIARISPIINRETGTTEAEIEIQNPDGRLRPGMLVNVTIAYTSEPTGLLVPQSALVAAEQKTYVFVAQQDSVDWKAKRIPVEVLGSSENRTPALIAVAGDLHSGDRVITLGQDNLRDGAAIRPSEGTTL